MSECRNCGRETCPTLTMPPLWGERYHGPGFSVKSSTPTARNVRKESFADCRAHARDWYAEAQQLRAELNAMTDRATVYRLQCDVARDAAARGDLQGVREALGGEE